MLVESTSAFFEGAEAMFRLVLAGTRQEILFVDVLIAATTRPMAIIRISFATWTMTSLSKASRSLFVKVNQLT